MTLITHWFLCSPIDKFVREERLLQGDFSPWVMSSCASGVRIRGRELDVDGRDSRGVTKEKCLCIQFDRRVILFSFPVFFSEA